MIFQIYKPKFPLDHFVECIFYHQGYDPTHKVDRFLPDGNVELIIDLDDKPKFIYDNETLAEIQTCRKAWASGVRTKPISIFSGKNSAMMIVYFKMAMAFPFFPFPMSELRDSVVGADLIWGDSFAILREKLLKTPEIRKKFECVENFLLENFQNKFEPNPCVEFAVGEIVRRPDRVNLSELSEKTGYSQKHFINLFKRSVGLTPKGYLKIMRFQKAVAEIDKSGDADWTGISLDCGFYDQAHFITDFKRFSGFTPERYLRVKSRLLNYVPVA